MSWNRVSKQNPCPICNLPDKACGVAQDGSVACCMRIPSDWECKGNMGGWIHKLSPDLVCRVKNVFRRTPKKKELPPKYWAELVDESLDPAGLKPRYHVLGLQLGLSDNSLERLLVGWLPQYSAWTFPMWDGHGRMIGIRLRGLNGDKWCVPGSFNGIFHPVCVANDEDTLLAICEGPTENAALLDLDFDAIARPNNLGGVNYLTDFLRAGRRQVVIMAHDDPGNASTMIGARKLAKAIGPLTTGVSIIQPPGGHNDFRDYLNGGGTREHLMELIK